MTNEKTAVAHWDGMYGQAPRMRVASGINIGTLNLMRLLRRYVREGDRFLEIGCAPGKILSWVARELRASVTGIDYSRPGAELTRQLLHSVGVPGDVRCEDVLKTTLPDESFDVVYSAGLIEHFDDPTQVVEKHVALVKPGGVAVITVPNYSGIYGRVQRHLDPANLGIHNLEIMDPRALAELGRIPGAGARAFYFGRFSPWIVSLDRAMPARLARAIGWAGNFLGQLQPVEIAAIAPLVVLEVRKR